MDASKLLVRRTLASRQKAAFRRPTLAPRLASVGTATPPKRYSQEQVLDLFNETNPKIRRLYCNSHIKTRFLYLPEPVDGQMPDETNQQLIDKHLSGCLEIGPQAIEQALQPLGLAPYDIDFLCCVSSTGLLVPGISAHLVKKMGFRENVWRSDLLGMGCNAAMNGLQVVTSLAAAHPGARG